MIEQKAIIKVGKNLKAVRISKGLSIENLATISNLDEAKLMAIENGEEDPLLSLIIRLAFKLDIDFRKLLVDADLY